MSSEADDDQARNEMLSIMGKVADVVATMTGIKKQFINAGWSERGAEEMTHQLFVASTVKGG